VRPYRDYLTPALHRRFNKASRYTLLFCYVIACFMGEWDDREQLDCSTLSASKLTIQHSGCGSPSVPRACVR
jgi:putative Ca2+/H+ antiporter (TMEM165/GDT1 family)